MSEDNLQPEHEPDLDRWEDWVRVQAWTYLRSRKPDLGCADDPRKVLPERLCRWLLDEQRWRAGGFAHVWQLSRSQTAAQFVIRSVEAWPDEEILTELGAEYNRAPDLALPPPRDGCIDLLGWWIFLDRGWRLAQGVRPTSLQLDTYGDTARTRLGYAVFFGLKVEDFAVRNNDERPVAVLMALGEIFATAWEMTYRHFYRDDWKILIVSKNYDPGAGKAWHYLHTSVARYVSGDMLDTRDPDVPVPTLTIRDNFRRMLKQAMEVLQPADRLGDDEADSLVDSLPAPCDKSQDASRDDSSAEFDRCMEQVLRERSPAIRAAFCLCHLPPEEWTKDSVISLARKLAVPAEGIQEFLTQRARLVDLAWKRFAACEEKEEYLSALIAKTVASLQNALAKQGLRADKIEKEIDSCRASVVPGLKRQELPTLPKGSRPDSLDFLVPWLQLLLWQQQKMRRYVERYGQERFGVSRAELQTLASLFGCSPDHISREMRAIKEAIAACLRGRLPDAGEGGRQ